MPPDPIETTPPLSADAPLAPPVPDPPSSPAHPLTPAPPVPDPRALPAKAFWAYSDLALIIGFVFAGLICIAGLHIALLPASQRNQPAPLDLWLQFVFYAIIYLGFVTVFQLRYRQPVLLSLGWRRAAFPPFLAALGGVALALALAFFASLLHTPQIETPIDKFVNSRSSLTLFIVTAVIVAPFFEELLFRGFIQPLLSRTFGLIAGVLLTALLFGGLHAPEYSWAWQYALVVTLAGAVFGWVRARTNSVLPGTVMHAFYNLAFVAGYLATTHGIFK